MSAGQEVQVWRAPAPLWILSGVVLAGEAIFYLWIVTGVGSGDRLVAILLPLALVVANLKIWFSVLRPRTLAGPDGLTIRDGRRTTHIAWAEIGRCDAGYSGVTVTWTNGARTLAAWPQKANSARWAGRTTRADHVAAYWEFRGKCSREGLSLDLPDTASLSGDVVVNDGPGTPRSAPTGDL